MGDGAKAVRMAEQEMEYRVELFNKLREKWGGSARENKNDAAAGAPMRKKKRTHAL
jgi:hypothetical protein